LWGKEEGEGLDLWEERLMGNLRYLEGKSRHLEGNLRDLEKIGDGFLGDFLKFNFPEV
jgi:hypothetical protein